MGKLYRNLEKSSNFKPCDSGRGISNFLYPANLSLIISWSNEPDSAFNVALLGQKCLADRPMPTIGYGYACPGPNLSYVRYLSPPPTLRSWFVGEITL